ncbi:hypothetical protein BGZ68_003699 [Mortierella alpina]|nr:hypothetical protein BGZ68_003699 [Mortierella alpina]
MYRSDSTGDPLMQTNSTSQLNTTWTCMTKNDASNINGSTDAVDEGACNGANDVRQSLKESNHQVSPGTVDNKPNKTQLQQATNPVETVVDNSNTEVLEQRHVPRGGMAISSTDYSADEGTLTGLDTHKMTTGVTNKFRGPFSYASALKTLQQPSQRGIGFEDDADLHTGVGTATTE